MLQGLCTDDTGMHETYIVNNKELRLHYLFWYKVPYMLGRLSFMQDKENRDAMWKYKGYAVVGTQNHSCNKIMPSGIAHRWQRVR